MNQTVLRTIAQIAVSAAFLAPPAQAAAAPAQLGRWITQSGNLEVDIAPCGTALCGTVVRVIANNSMSAPGTVMAAADQQSPLGKNILSDFVPSGDAEWKGHIYNRENGETYDCLMSLAGPDELKIRPYKGMPMFGKTQLWRRVVVQAAQ